MQIFAGVEQNGIEAATRAYLRNEARRCARLLLDVIATSWSGVEIVLVSELALFPPFGEMPWVDSVQCSSLECSAGRLTGEISLILGESGQRQAMARYVDAHKMRADDYTFWRHNDFEETDVRGVA